MNNFFAWISDGAWEPISKFQYVRIASSDLSVEELSYFTPTCIHLFEQDGIVKIEGRIDFPIAMASLQNLLPL